MGAVREMTGDGPARLDSAGRTVMISGANRGIGLAIAALVGTANWWPSKPPQIGPRRIFANLAPVKGKKGRHVILWNARD